MTYWYEMKEIFKNKLNVHSPWWNETEETMLIAFFDERDVLIKEVSILPHDYIIVPSNTTLKLISLG